MEAVFTFHNTHHAIRGEQALLAGEIQVKVMPLPSQLGAGCGLCLRVPETELPRAREILAEADIEPQGLYWKRLENGRTVYTPCLTE